ncbi:MAG: family 4 glycosyl hydrolase [Promethearchaeota archaeon]
MLKISFIGAASLVFGENIISDLLSFPTLRKDMLMCLEDIDSHRLDLIYQYFQKYKELNEKELDGVQIEKTTDQKKAVEDAKYIINAVHVGGLDAYKLDVEIPYKYGVSQTVGDTLGPGGVFRFLRTVPFFKELLEQIKDVGYNADKKEGKKPLLLNYTNPMAINTWYCNSIYPDSTVGLCHGVQGTAQLLSLWLEAKQEEVSYFCAGINHMAWFLELWYKDSKDPNARWQNAYPLLHEKFEKLEKLQRLKGVRWDMMKATGYFMTESDGHLSEYLPYYRKRKDLLEKYRVGPDWLSTLEQASDYHEQVKYQESLESYFRRKMKRRKLPFKKTASDEYASHIINALETGVPFRFNGNVINKEGSLITNLPKNCCVEVPIFADKQGLHPQGGITLPTICQALCMSNIMVQKAAVEGALTLDKEKIYHAILLDPNTASVCSPGEIREMVNEMFDAEKKWINYFD